MAALQPGDPLPTLFLADESGARVPAPRGETLYAIFKTTCPTCELTWPYLDRIRRSFGGEGLRILAVSQDDPEKTAAFHRRLGVSLDTAYDAEPWKASDALGVATVPAFFRVGADGRIEETAVGFARDQMEKFARRAASLSGRPFPGLFRDDDTAPAVKPG